MSETTPIAVVDSVAPEGWRKQIAAVMFQLGLGSRKTAELYAAGRQALDTIDGRSIVNKALAEKVAQQVSNDPDIVERAKARFLGEELTKQENLEAVIALTSDKLTALSPPLDKKSDEGVTEKHNDEPVLEPDWASTLTRAAECASSDELRERLARILAGEIHRPGTYPRSTIRKIVELEKDDIQAMIEALHYRIDRVLYPIGISADRIRYIADKLTEAGMIRTDLVHNSSLPIDLSYIDGKAGTLVGKKLGLIIQSDQAALPLKDCQILSNFGIVIADLLDDGYEEKALRQIAGRLASTKKVQLAHVVLSSTDGQVNLNPFETLVDNNIITNT